MGEYIPVGEKHFIATAEDVAHLKETIESFGLFVDESGYLCQQLESEE